jgi:hypothetical protein
MTRLPPRRASRHLNVRPRSDEQPSIERLKLLEEARREIYTVGATARALPLREKRKCVLACDTVLNIQE